MNWPLIHIGINHIPIILIMLGGGAAIVGLLLNRRAVWLYAVATLTLAGLSVYPAYIAGERAEEVDEEYPGVSHDLIEEHEEAAVLSLYVVLVVGVVSALAWWRLSRREASAEVSGWLRAIVTVAAVVGMASMGYTAFRGGAIRHPQEHGETGGGEVMPSAEPAPRP